MNSAGNLLSIGYITDVFAIAFNNIERCMIQKRRALYVKHVFLEMMISEIAEMFLLLT